MLVLITTGKGKLRQVVLPVQKNLDDPRPRKGEKRLLTRQMNGGTNPTDKRQIESEPPGDFWGT